MTLPDWFHSPAAAALGWTLLHSLWELAALAALAALVLAVLRRHSAHVRYAVACVTLTLMCAAPVGTYVVLMPSRGTPAALAAPTLMAAHYHYIDPHTGESVPLALPVALSPAPVLQPSSLVDRGRALIEPYLSIAVLIYFAGIALLALRLALGYFRLCRLIRNAEPMPTLQITLDTLARRLSLTRPVRLRNSALVEVPTLIGAVRPVILFPASALTGFSPDQLTAIMAHELAHIRRHDFLVNTLQCVIETLLFYHPAVWWLSARIRQEREHCCDDIALAVAGDRTGYARALERMEMLRTAPAGVPAGAVLAARGGVLLPRIRRILGLPPQRDRSTSLAAALFAMILLAALIYVGCTNSMPPKPPAPVAQNQNTIAVESRVLLVSDSFLNDFRVGWDQLVPEGIHTEVNLPKGLLHASVIDNWTLNLLLTAAQADKRSLNFTPKRLETPEGKDAHVTTRDLGSSPPAGTPAAFAAAFDVKPTLSDDLRFVNLTVHDLTVAGRPSAALGSAASGPFAPQALRVPDGGTLLINLGSIEGHFLGLLMVRPNITHVANARYVKSDDTITTARQSPDADGNLTMVFDARELLMNDPQEKPAALPTSIDQWLESPSTQPFGQPQPPKETYEQRQTRLLAPIIATLKAAVAPNSWTDNGGKGSIRIRNGQLIVIQSPANQAAVFSLLAHLRAAASFQVAVQARIMLVSDATLKEMRLEKPAAPARGPATTAPATEWKSTLLDDAKSKTTLNAAEKARDTTTVAAPRVILFNARPGYIELTQHQNIVESTTPSKEPGGKPDLNIRILRSGVILYAQGTAAPDHKSIALDLHAWINAIDGIDTILLPEVGKEAFKQVPRTRTVETTSRQSIPAGQTCVLVGPPFAGDIPVPTISGTSAPQKSPPQQNPATRNLIMIVRPELIEHQEIGDELFGPGYDHPTGTP